MLPPFLMTAKHAHPNVRSEQDYRTRQREAIDQARRYYPNLPWRDPWVSADTPAVFISGGRLVIECTTTGCGNCPMVAPEWGAEGLALALCYECGAVYERIELPADLPQIEALLTVRSVLAHRYWNPMLSLAHLAAENAANGVG